MALTSVDVPAIPFSSSNGKTIRTTEAPVWLMLESHSLRVSLLRLLQAISAAFLTDSYIGKSGHETVMNVTSLSVVEKVRMLIHSF